MTQPTYAIAHGNTAVQAARIVAEVAAGRDAEQRPTVAWQQCGDLQAGDEVMVGGEWYPVAGYSLRVERSGKSGSVFTLKPYGKFEPFLGYRINYADITDHRRPNTTT